VKGRPFVLFCLKSLTILRRIWRKKDLIGVDLIFRRRKRAYVNAELCKEHDIMIFIPSVNGLRKIQEFTEKKAVFFMDSLSEAGKR
jgi:hypothetical protein